MEPIELFPDEKIIGVFRGFREGGLEFHADLVLPYRNEFQNLPMHGQFLLVQLETPDEAVLGRIASFSSEGKLSTGVGEEFNIRAVREGRPVPEDLREQYLKYRVNIRVLGVLRHTADGKLTFVASHRRLPHVGSPVAFPSDSVLQEIAGHNMEGAGIGHFALGEFVYASSSQVVKSEEWMQLKTPEVLVKFPVKDLVSRRSFIFARAGFGKSNLNKLLFSKLYETRPTVSKRDNPETPVGTLIFDPEGEYFWPDDQGRPGLCDVPELRDKLVVFTSRHNPSAFYQSFVAGGIKLDIRRLKPADVIAISLSPERQDQQNVRKLRGLDMGRWEELVDLIDQHGNSTPRDDIGRILGLEGNSQEAEAIAARSNMTNVVRMLHDKSSRLMDMLMYALRQGCLCVVDVSQMRGGQALVLSGLILRRIFDHNQEEFTKAHPNTVPVIAVIEEAQSVLDGRASASEPYVTWVKEGRKYDLGAVMVTQQPGSIPTEILSQGDNWFIFHLLSASDLASVHKANAHFSDDLLSVLLNEPIHGHGVFWSSVGGKPYPVSVRVLSFEHMYRQLDRAYVMPAHNTVAAQIRGKFEQEVQQAAAQQAVPVGTRLEGQPSFWGTPGRSAATLFADSEDHGDEGVDVLGIIEGEAINAFLRGVDLLNKIQRDGAPWGEVKAFFVKVLPNDLDDRENVAYNMVKKAMEKVFGTQDEAWTSFRHGPRNAVYVRALCPPRLEAQ